MISNFFLYPIFNLCDFIIDKLPDCFFTTYIQIKDIFHSLFHSSFSLLIISFIVLFFILFLIFCFRKKLSSFISYFKGVN